MSIKIDMKTDSLAGKRFKEMFEAIITYCYYDLLDTEKELDKVLTREETEMMIDAFVDSVLDTLSNNKKLREAMKKAVWRVYHNEKLKGQVV